MNCFLAQINLLARNGDGEGWINILVLVALAIFYVVGSILKAKTNKDEQKGDEQLARKPAGKPPEGVRDLQKQPLERPRRPAGPPPRREYGPQVQLPRRKVMRPQPAVQKPVAKLEPEGELVTIEPPEEPELSIPTLQLEPKFEELEELPDFTGKTVKKLEAQRIGVSVPAEVPEAKYLAEILLDYADPDELRRAILHYEILGRPLSLRGPSEHIIGL